MVIVLTYLLFFHIAYDLGFRIGVQTGVRLGNVINKCDSSHVLLFFIDVLISRFEESVGNLVNNL